MKILINGSKGHMGAYVKQAVDKGFEGSELAGFVDVLDNSLQEFNGQADCIIDFSHHAATKVLMDYAVAHKLPVILATTGQNEEEMDMVREAAKVVPILRSGNMSMGVILMSDLVRTAVKAFPDADVEIMEIHHTRKVDAPSGTAVLFGNAVLDARPDAHLVTGRTEESGVRDKKEVTIHSLRMGNIVGTHEVLINTGSQVLTFKHEALDRAMFAEGAVTAAKYLIKQQPGLYDMHDMLASL